MTDLQLRISNYVRRGISKQQMCKLLDISYIQLMDYLEQFNLIKEQEKEEILVNKIKELQRTKTVDQIAIELGVNYQYLKNKIHFISQNTIKEENMKAAPKWSQEEIDLLIKYKTEGKDWNEISKLIGRPSFASATKWSEVKKKLNVQELFKIEKPLENFVKVMKDSTKTKLNSRVAYSKEEDEQIISLHKQGVPYKEIAKQLGRKTGDAIYTRWYQISGKKAEKKQITPKVVSETLNYNWKNPVKTVFTKTETDINDLKKSVDEMKVENISTYKNYEDINLEMLKSIIASGRRAVILL